MLPNFRRSEPEASDTHSSPFQPRPFLSVPRSAGEAAKSVSIIGAGLTITGNLSCKGEVQVDGIVEGDIQGSHVVIGEDATVTGSISGEEVIVRGHVVGSVRGRRVMLQTTSQVESTINRFPSSRAPSSKASRAGRRKIHARSKRSPNQSHSSRRPGCRSTRTKVYRPQTPRSFPQGPQLHLSGRLFVSLVGGRKGFHFLIARAPRTRGC